MGELTGSSRWCGLLTGAGLAVVATVYFFVGLGRLAEAAKRLGSWAVDVSLDTFGFQVYTLSLHDAQPSGGERV